MPLVGKTEASVRDREKPIDDPGLQLAFPTASTFHAISQLASHHERSLRLCSVIVDHPESEHVIVEDSHRGKGRCPWKGSFKLGCP